jgi:protein tyrosine/serine phosphatase
MRDRRLVWDGLLNVRDLGGHATEDGGHTAFGAVIRADSVRRLSAAGWTQLLNYGIARIVDLRHTDELAADPPAELPVEVVHVPVLPDPAWPYWAEIDAVADEAGAAAAARAAVYLEFLDRFDHGFAAAISAVAGAGPGGVLVHCFAGKDRTGLVAALLLRLAGVSVRDVAADYALSEENLRELSKPWIERAEDELERERRRRTASAPASAMETVLRKLDERGGAGEYLRAAGVPDMDLGRVRERLRA